MVEVATYVGLGFWASSRLSSTRGGIRPSWANVWLMVEYVVPPTLEAVGNGGQ